MALTMDKAAFAAWRESEISLRSLILHSVGCIFVGTPEALNMPPDFYYLEGDRNVPHPNDYSWERQRELLYVDTFRRELTNKLAGWCIALGLALFLANLVLQGATSGTKAVYQKIEGGIASMSRKNPAEMSHDEALARVKEIMSEYKEQRNNPEADGTKLAERQRELEVLLRRYPDLRQVIWGN